VCIISIIMTIIVIHVAVASDRGVRSLDTSVC
jgi:uncharacterized membrane protein